MADRDALDPSLTEWQSRQVWGALAEGNGPGSKGELVFCAVRDAAIHAKKTDQRLDELNGATRRAIGVLNATVERFERHIRDHVGREEAEGRVVADVAVLMDERNRERIGRSILRSFTSNSVAAVGVLLVALNITMIVIQFWRL